MIILRQLAQGAWHHADERFTEWLGAVPLMGLGFVWWAEPAALDATRSFAVLAAWASAVIWSNVLLACGLNRLVALFVNGRFRSFPHSPLLRFISSCVAALFWTLFTVGVFKAWRDVGGSPTGIVAYGTLIALELRNAYVSRVDMARGRAAYAGPDR